MELKALQQQFYQAIFEPKNHQTFKQDYLNTATGLEIYRSSIIGNFCLALQAIYPVCVRVVGEAFFTATAKVYIQQFPAESPDLGQYGQTFPEFLSEFEPAAQLPYLPDLARLEWHWHCIFHGEPNPTLDYQALGKIPPENWGDLVFKLPQNSILLESIYPIHQIWQVNQPDYQGDETVDLNAGNSRIFLWRQEYEMRMELPSLAEWQLLQGFQTHDTLDSICETLATVDPEIDVGALLPLFVQRGWIVNFEV